MHTINKFSFPPLIALISFLSCKKSEFLGTKPDSALIVPATLSDCQALLDNDVVMNGYGNAGYPSMLENGTDDFYVTPTQFDAYPDADKNAVAWLARIFSDTSVDDWDLPYRTVYYANEIMEVLSALHPAPEKLPNWNQAKGSALFFRAFAFYQLAQVFAPAYDSGTAAQDPGIPLRMTTDVNERIYRSSVLATYRQIIADLGTAAPLLPQNPAGYPTRPTKAAVYGLLSRVYLCMYDYPAALSYADSCLRLRHDLMHYDTISQTAYLPFSRTNPEVIFAAAYRLSGPSVLTKSFTDTTLYKAYQSEDCRKKLFFKMGSCFFGKYDQDGFAFCGIAVDEMYLVRAECYARTGNITAAMDDLNTLLTTRWPRGRFTAATASDTDDALQQILIERRKELLFRGLRWTDLRRLNKDYRWATTLKRNVDGATHTLPPNDPRYVYPIPDNVISFNPGMPQNPR